MMRNFLMTALAGGALAVFGVVPDASARDYPFCFIGEHFPPPLGDCSYDTYQQCKAFAFGLRGYCDVNPYFDYRRAGVAPPRHPYPSSLPEQTRRSRR
jgi:Protein of unknown function (DUF3551)